MKIFIHLMFGWKSFAVDCLIINHLYYEKERAGKCLSFQVGLFVFGDNNLIGLLSHIKKRLSDRMGRPMDGVQPLYGRRLDSR